MVDDQGSARTNMYNDRNSEITVLIEEAVTKLDTRLSEVMQGHHDSLLGKMEQLLEQWNNYMGAPLDPDFLDDEAVLHVDFGTMPTPNSGSAPPKPTTQSRVDRSQSDDSEESDEGRNQRRATTMRHLFSHDSTLSMTSRDHDKLFPKGRHVVRESQKELSANGRARFIDTLVHLFSNLTRGGSDGHSPSVTSSFRSHPRVAFQNVRNIAVVCVGGPCFDIICGGVIVVNTILLGVEAELSSSEYGHRDLRLSKVYVVLSSWYIFELLLRVFAFGRDYFVGDDWRWNWFDCFLVCTAIVDTVMQRRSIIRMARFFRIARAVRLYRQLRLIAEFRKMIYSIASSSMTLLWSFVLLFFMLYAFALYVAGNVRDFTADDNNTSHKSLNKLKHSFGSLWKSIYTLFLCISTGESWGEVANLLGDVDRVFPILFCGFIFIVIFGILNVVMAVFVDSAMQSTQHYKELMVQENQRCKELYMRHIRDIFTQMDTDGSGTLSMEEMIDFLTNESLQLSTYFDALDLNAFDAHALFRLLDDDKSGAVDIDEFCTGCMRLKGVAKSFDVHCGMYEMSRMFRDITNQLTRLGKRSKKSYKRLQMLEHRLEACISMPRLVQASARTSTEQDCVEDVLDASGGDEGCDVAQPVVGQFVANPSVSHSQKSRYFI